MEPSASHHAQPAPDWPALNCPLITALLAHLPVALWIIDRDYRLLYASHVAQSRLALPSLDPGVVALPAESRQRTIWLRCYERALSGEAFATIIDGWAYWLQPIIHTRQDQVIAVIEQESALLATTTLSFRAAVETLPDPFAICEVIRNLRGQIVDARLLATNAAMCLLTGYQRAEIIGQRLLDLFPVFASDGTFASLCALVETGAPLRRHTTLTGRRGETYQTEIHAGRLNDGFVAIWRDVTLQHALNQRVKQQAELLDHIADAVIATDINYVIASWNRGAEQIYGWSAAEVIGKPLRDVTETRFAGTDSAEAAALLLQTGRWEGEVEQRRRDGQFVPIHSIVVLIRDDDGTPSRIVAVNRDMSERRHFEQLLLKANQRLEQAIIDARRQTNEVLLVNELHDLLQVCQTQTEAAEVIAFSLQRLFPRQSGYLMIRQPGTVNLTLLTQWGDQPTVLPTITIDQCWALRRGLIHRACPNEAIRCQHTRADPDHCTCCVPLVVQGDIYGLLHVAGAELPRSELIVMTGDTIKLALSNLDLRATLREQAIIDPLTSLYNRRYLESSLPRELHRAQRKQQPLTIAMVDIDHFKHFNDQYGHDAGDTLLRELATVLRAHLRQSDLACRYGGEEFVLILPGVNHNAARNRLNQLRETIQTRSITFAGQLLGPVTISIGFTVHQSGAGDARRLLQQADEALYAAKRSGRNRVVAFADLAPSSTQQGHE